jgi:hypothetical protein
MSADQELEKHVAAIMRKMKGWKAKDMRDDARDYPEAHAAEREWLRQRLDAVAAEKGGES